MSTAKIIGIDASRANVTKRTGVGWYAFHLIQELKKIIPEEYRVVLYSREPLRDGLENLPRNWESRVLNWPPKRLWTQLRLSWEMLRRPPYLLFVLAHALPLVLPRKSAVTLHDVGFMVEPEAYKLFERWYQRFIVRFAVQRGARVFTVSEFSKSEFIKHFKVPAENICVTLLAYDAERFHALNDAEEARGRIEKYGIRRPYFLFVGRLEKKKNLAGLLEAFRIFTKSGGGAVVRLVLAGRRGYGGDEAMDERLTPDIAGGVVELGYVAPDDLPFLYAGAEAFVFPSLYEGFGIPALEAMASGVPVIASRAGAIPEVAGDAALYVDTAKPDEIASAMTRVTSDQELRERLVFKGFDRVKNFSWRRTAEQTWKELERLLAEK